MAADPPPPRLRVLPPSGCRNHEHLGAGDAEAARTSDARLLLSTLTLTLSTKRTRVLTCDKQTRFLLRAQDNLGLSLPSLPPRGCEAGFLGDGRTQSRRRGEPSSTADRCCGRGCARRRLDPGRTNEALQSCYSGAPGRAPGAPPPTLLTRRAHVRLRSSTRPTRCDTVGDVVAGQPSSRGGGGGNVAGGPRSVSSALISFAWLRRTLRSAGLSGAEALVFPPTSTSGRLCMKASHAEPRKQGGVPALQRLNSAGLRVILRLACFDENVFAQ